MTMMRPVRAVSVRSTLYPTLCWKSEGNQLWFQFPDALPKSVKAYKTVVTAADVHKSVSGVYLVESVTWEQGAETGPTLLMITAKVDNDDQVVYHKDSTGSDRAIPTLNVVCEVEENLVSYLERLKGPPINSPEDVVQAVDALCITDEESMQSDSGYVSSESDGYFVPFDPESYGLSNPSASQEIIDAAVCSLKLEVEQALRSLCHLLRFIVHSDSTGINTVKILSKHILDGIHSALMQRGDGLCIVLQRMVPSVAAATLEIHTAEAFHGGVLMQILYILEDIHRTKQVNVRTIRIEEAPDNLFAHIDGEGLTKAALGERSMQ